MINTRGLSPVALAGLALCIATCTAALAETSNLQNLKKSEFVARKTLKLSEKSTGVDSQDTVVALNNLVRIEIDLGKYAQAEPLYKRVIAIKEKANAASEDLSAVYDDISNMYVDEEKYSLAELFIKKALRLREKAEGPQGIGVQKSLNNLAALYRAKGDLTQAISFAERAVAIARTEQTRGGSTNDLSTNLNNLALLCREKGDTRQTGELFKEVVDLNTNDSSTKPGEYANNLNNLARFYRDNGHLDEAEPLYKKSLKLRETTFGAHSSEVGATLRNYALLLRKMNRDNEANSLDERAEKIENETATN